MTAVPSWCRLHDERHRDPWHRVTARTAHSVTTACRGSYSEGDYETCEVDPPREDRCGGCEPVIVVDEDGAWQMREIGGEG